VIKIQNELILEELNDT